jgi:hypothetical protein
MEHLSIWNETVRIQSSKGRKFQESIRTKERENEDEGERKGTLETSEEQQDSRGEEIVLVMVVAVGGDRFQNLQIKNILSIIVFIFFVEMN